MSINPTDMQMESETGYTCPKCGNTSEFTADHIDLWGSTSITADRWNWEDNPHDARLADDAHLTCETCGYENEARCF